MSFRSNLVVAILILFGLFLVARFLNFGHWFRPEVCPPDKCTSFKDVDPLLVSSRQEPGRAHKDFLPSVPPGLPGNMPIDSKPLQVVKSYTETMQANKDNGELGSTQITYSYITSQNTKTVIDNFEKYFKKDNYTVNARETPPNQSISYLSGHKISLQSDQLVTISVANQNQFERLVNISLIISPVAKNQP